MGKGAQPPPNGEQAFAQTILMRGGDKMARRPVQISSDTLADFMRDLIEDFNTARNYGVVDGVHAWTFCAMAMHLSHLMEDSEGFYQRQEDFLVRSGYYKVAAHASMEGFPYSRVPDQPEE